MGMHRIYSYAGKMSIYVVVFNLEWLLGMHKCDSRCSRDCERNPKDTIKFLNFWLNLIARNTGAPVLLIGTHKDKVVSGADLAKSNAHLAATNADIKRANEIVARHVRSMKVYRKKILKLHLPKQPSSFGALDVSAGCVVHANACYGA